MKRFLTTTATVILFFLVCCTMLFAVLPWAVTSSSPQLLQKINIAQGELRLDSFSFSRAVISGFLGAKERSALSFPRVEIQYSPKRIMQAKIDSVEVEEAVINFDLVNGQLRVRGLPPAAPDQEDPAAVVIPALPFSVGEIRFHHCRAIIHTADKPPLSLSFNSTIQIRTSDRINGSYLIENISASLDTDSPAPATLSVILEKHEDKVRVGLTADIADLNRLHALAPQIVPAMSGQGELKAELTVPENLAGFDQLSASLSLKKLALRKGGVHIRSGDDEPLLMRLNGSDKKLEYAISGLEIASSHTISARLNGTIQPRGGLLNGTGTIGSDFLTDPLQLSFNAKSGSEKPTLNVSLASDKQKIPLSTGIVHTGPFTLTTQIIRKPEGISATGTMLLESLQSDQPDLDIGPTQAIFTHTPDTENKMGETTGRISIPAIRYQGEDLAETTMQFTIPSATRRLQFGGSIVGHQEQPVRLLFSGSYDQINELKLTYGIEKTEINNYSLPLFAALPDGTDISADVSASGNFVVAQGTAKGYLKLKLQNGTVRQQEKNISVNGIATELTFDNLPQTGSRKNQLLTIDSIDINTIHINNGSISYQLENDGSLFIEKSRFGWCGGKVEIGSTRITPKSESFSTTLYCDRLQFAELLTQLGISDTDGDGSLNGRLPVGYSKDGFVFDDGFLFSTPGNSGIVRFNNTDMLQQSLPDMSQAAYLDYSIQALENFSYNWTKLTFNSIDQDLLISMQIDGKPAIPLPYGYKNGHLVKKASGSGIQHPLRLDINFHLPFGEMFKYGHNLQKILENM